MSSDIKFSQNYNSSTFREEIDVTFPKENFEKHFQKALQAIRKTASAPGFRKGNVPENVVLGKYLQDINNKALSYSIEESVKSLGEITPRPAEPLNVDKIEQEESGDIKFLMTYLPVPEITLSNMTDISVDKGAPKKATEEEVTKELQNVWFHFAKNIDAEIKKEDFTLDKINEEFLEKSGLKNVYKDVNSAEDLKNQIELFINQSYENNALLDWESQIQDKIIEKSTYEKVEGLIEKELGNRVNDYKSRFAQLGMDPDKYIAENNVDLEALKAEWKPSAEKYVKLELSLQKYGQEKGFVPTNEEIESELAALEPGVKERYKNNPENLRALISYYYVNQKSFQDIQELVKANSNSSNTPKEVKTSKKAKK